MTLEDRHREPVVVEPVKRTSMGSLAPLSDEIEFAAELLNGVSVGVALVDEGGTVSFCNRSAESIFGCESTEIIGKKLSQWVHEPFRSELDTYIARRIRRVESKRLEFERQVILKRADGSVLPIQLHLEEIVFMEGPHIAATLRDHREEKLSVNAYRKFRERFNRQEDEGTRDLRICAQALGQSNQDLEDFSRIASHDLQEPLHKIMILGDRLLECGQSLDEKSKDTIARMIRSVGRMSGLIEDIFLYSSVTLPSYSEATTHLKPVMENVLRDLETLIQETGGRVEFYGGAFLNPLILINGSRSLIHQLLLNLISNALKFNREGLPPLVRVRAGISDSHPDRCEIEVEDNGIGFDEKYVDRIFKPFQRLQGTGQYPSNGMGLTICRKIVNRHGGTIAVHSRPGRGSRFVVRLPVQ